MPAGARQSEKRPCQAPADGGNQSRRLIVLRPGSGRASGSLLEGGDGPGRA